MSQNQKQAPLVEIDVCGAENIITLVSSQDSAMQPNYTFAGVKQKATVSLRPGTRVDLEMAGADNQVFVSKQLTVAVSDDLGAENGWEYFSEESR